MRGQAVDAVAAEGGSGAASLLQPLLQDEDWVVAFKAACGLAWLGDDSGGEVLIQALGRPDLCFLALEALTALGSEKGLPGLRQFFRRRALHPLERAQAAAALHRAGDPQGLAWLESRFAEGQPEERGFAIELWGRLDLPGALERLSVLLREPSDPHRMDAVRGLVALGDRRALPLLRDVAADGSDPELAEEAGEAVAAIEESPTA